MELPILKQGRLNKRGGSRGGWKNWRKRWFVLDPEKLSYYADENAFQNGVKALGVLDLQTLRASYTFHNKDDTSLDESTCGHSCQVCLTFNLISKDRIILVKCKTIVRRNEWITIVNKVSKSMRTKLNGLRDIDLQARARFEKMHPRVIDPRKPPLYYTGTWNGEQNGERRATRDAFYDYPTRQRAQRSRSFESINAPRSRSLPPVGIIAHKHTLSTMSDEWSEDEDAAPDRKTSEPPAPTADISHMDFWRDPERGPLPTGHGPPSPRRTHRTSKSHSPPSSPRVILTKKNPSPIVIHSVKYSNQAETDHVDAPSSPNKSGLRVSPREHSNRKKPLKVIVHKRAQPQAIDTALSSSSALQAQASPRSVNIKLIKLPKVPNIPAPNRHFQPRKGSETPPARTFRPRKGSETQPVRLFRPNKTPPARYFNPIRRESAAALTDGLQRPSLPFFDSFGTTVPYNEDNVSVESDDGEEYDEDYNELVVVAEKAQHTISFEAVQDHVLSSGMAVPKLSKELEISYLSTILDALTDLTSDSPDFRKSILLFHKLFMSTERLIGALTSAFNVPPEQYADSRVYTASQLHILEIFEQWIKEFPAHFTDHEEILLMDFFKLAVANLETADSEIHRRLAFVKSCLMTRYELQYQSLENKTPEAPANFIRKFVAAVDLLEIGSQKLAESLTLLHETTYRAIKPSEFVGRCWAKGDSSLTSPNILKYIESFNTCSYWVASEVLRRHISDDRQKMIQKFIKVALYCVKVGNFHGAFGIFAGLNQQAVFRLKDDWNALPQKTQKLDYKLRELTISSSNYRNYRRRAKLFVGKPILPHLAITVKDLTGLHDGISTWNHKQEWKCTTCMFMNEQSHEKCQMCHTQPLSDSGLKEEKLNFHKFFKQLEVINNFLEGQQIPFDFEKDSQVLVSVQKLICSRTLTVEQLSQKSHRIRPRPQNAPVSRRKSRRKITM